jgi:multidrug resistance efflux pump
MRQFYITFVIMIITVTAGVLGYIYWNDQQLYISTNNAKLEAELYPVIAIKNGTLTDWKVKNGDKVNQGEVIGKIADQNISAPATATVVKTAVYPKQTVFQGQTLAQLANLDQAYILAYIDETKIGQVKLGKDVKVTIESLTNSDFSGKVTEIGYTTGDGSTPHSTTKEVQHVPVKITIDHLPTDRLILGTHAKVKIKK